MKRTAHGVGPVSCLFVVGSGAAIAQVLGAGPDPEPEPPQRSPELALALASGYQHDPEQLLDMQQALFDASESEGLVGKQRSKSSGPEPGLPVMRLSCLMAQCALCNVKSAILPVCAVSF